MKNKIFFIIFMIIWVVLIILNFLVPKQSFSEQENRYLATIPEFNIEDLVNGKYAENLNDYINDHFILRNFWLKFNSAVQLLTGKTENNGVYIGKDEYLFEKFNYGKNEEKNLEMIATSVNEFAENINIPIYFLLAPNSIYINEDKLPENLEVFNQNTIIEEFYNKINKNIKTINVVDILKENKDKQLYYRTDHHMTSYGTYLLYLKYCEVAKIKSAPLSDFEKQVVSTEFLGTFDSKAQVLNQEKDEIEVYKSKINQNVEGDYDGVKYNSIFNEDYLTKKDKYSYFLNGNSAKVVIKTKVKNGKKLLVIKDSYAHAFSQFICENYEEIHFIDPRYYKMSMSEYISQNDITETLFLYNVSNIVTDVSLRLIK